MLPHAQEKLEECADWIGLPQDGGNRAEAFVAAVNGLLAQIDLTPSLADLGVTAEMVARFPGEVTGRLDTDPGYSGPDDIERIYKAAWVG